jgi:UDP-N-acetyl-D-glucosamine dehydrogenase
MSRQGGRGDRKGRAGGVGVKGSAGKRATSEKPRAGQVAASASKVTAAKTGATPDPTAPVTGATPTPGPAEAPAGTGKVAPPRWPDRRRVSRAAVNQSEVFREKSSANRVAALSQPSAPVLMSPATMTASASLMQRLSDRSAQVVVVGAGYVGLPLAVEIAQAGYNTIAFDKSARKIDAINAGKSYIDDVPTAAIEALVKAKRLSGSINPDVLATADAVIICVPTPLNKTKDPDNSYILDAADLMVSRMRPQQLFVLESTTFPGFTSEVLLPKLSSTGLKLDKDFFLAFSPERVDPGNAKYHTKNTPKVIGGESPLSLEHAVTLYGKFIDKVVPVSSTDTAEMVKLLENTFRAVNIGLVNEVAIMCGRLGLDTWEVIEAAATKPFGFMPFFPGPGLGGHCIPIDPLYLSWKLKTLKYNARFIALADEVNSGMPELVVTRVQDALNDRGKAIRGAKILVVGVTYKKDIDDARESPALDVIKLLETRGGQVSYHDRHVSQAAMEHEGIKTPAVGLDDIEKFDCVLITTNHSNVDYEALTKRATLVVDTRNATKDFRRVYRNKIVSL